MAIFPLYEDPKTDDRFLAGQRKGRLPFYISYNRPYPRYPLHYHDFAELSFVIAGSGTETVNGVSHELRRGTMSLLLPHHMHEIVSNPSDPLHIYSCMFDIDILFANSYESYLNRWLHKVGTELPSYCHFDGEKVDEISSIVDRIAREYKDSRLGRDAMLRSKLIETVTLMLRALIDRASEPEPESGREPHPRAWSILRYIHLHFHEPITLNSVSAHFNLHASYISRMFKEHTGKTVNDYMHSLRIARATTLLAASSMSISDICMEVGYDTYRTFARVFREHHGMSPSEYRLLHTTRKRGAAQDDSSGAVEADSR